MVICVVAAIVGLGGGVFIRPILDAVGYHDFNNIQFLSSSAIIVMAIVSTAKRMKDGTRIDMPLAILISIGAIIGGFFGDWILDYLQDVMGSERSVQFAQTITTMVTLSLVILLTIKSDKRYELKSKAIPPMMGFGMGILAVFLGIGGGPFNVPMFMIFLGLTPKNATAYSLVVIFFTHTTRMVRTGFTSNFFAEYDTSVLPFVIAAAAIGGLIGAKFNKLMSDETVKKMFIASLAVVIMLNLFNSLRWVV